MNFDSTELDGADACLSEVLGKSGLRGNLWLGKGVAMHMYTGAEVSCVNVVPMCSMRCCRRTFMSTEFNGRPL